MEAYAISSTARPWKSKKALNEVEMIVALVVLTPMRVLTAIEVVRRGHASKELQHRLAIIFCFVLGVVFSCFVLCVVFPCFGLSQILKRGARGSNGAPWVLHTGR